MPSRFIELSDAPVDAGFVARARAATAEQAAELLATTTELSARGGTCLETLVGSLRRPTGAALVFLVASFVLFITHRLAAHALARRFVKIHGVNRGG